MFMYLQLSREDNGHVHVRVVNEGTVRSLGAPNSRNSHQPLAVFAIDGFDGIECIEEDVLWDELQRRPVYGGLASRFLREAATEDLLAELARRTKR